VDIKESNRLIAEFIGWKKDKNQDSYDPKKPYDQYFDLMDTILTKHLQFHELWDWLMPVRQKIVDL